MTTIRTRSVVVAVAVAGLLGIAMALLVFRAGEAVQPAPDTAAIGALVYPGAAVATSSDAFGDDRPAWRAFMAAEDGPAGMRVGPRVQPTGAVASLIAATRARVDAAGWRTGDGEPDSRAFSAARGDARFDFYAYDTDPGGLDTFTVVRKRPAAWVVTLTVAAGLAAAALGWRLGLVGARRIRTIGAGARTAIRETVVVGLALTLPAVVQTVFVLSGHSTSELPLPQWASLLLDYARWPAALGLLLLLAAAAGLIAARSEATSVS